MANAMVGRCPRCEGRLFRESDSISEFFSCLCCGFVREAVSTMLSAEALRRYTALQATILGNETRLAG